MSWRGGPSPAFPRLSHDWEVRRPSPRFSRDATVARETRTARSPSGPCPASLFATQRLALAATFVHRRAARPRSGVGARSPGPSGGFFPLGSRACARPSTQRQPGLARPRLQTDPRLAACLAAGARGRHHQGRQAGAEDGALAGEKAGRGDVAAGIDRRASTTPTRTRMRARRQGQRGSRGAAGAVGWPGGRRGGQDCGTVAGPPPRSWEGGAAPSAKATGS